MDICSVSEIDNVVQEKTKTCFKCGEVKPLSEFYKHAQMADGHLNKCKVCAKKDVSKNYRENVGQYKKYERKRAKTRWRYITEKTREWRENNPEKYKAQNKVNNALRDGRLKKKPCFICGNKNVHAHHYDYSKPLDVIWLCAQHHKWMHSIEAA